MLKPDYFSEGCVRVRVRVYVCSNQRMKVYRRKGQREDKYLKLRLSRWPNPETGN